MSNAQKLSTVKAKTRKISHAGARNKGLSFERTVSAYFRAIGFLKAGRKLEFQTAHAVGVDIEKSGPFAIQCKAFQKYAPLSCIEEIQDKTRIPVLVTKGNLKTPLVALPLEDFLRLAQAFMQANPHEDFTDPRDIDLGF